MEEDKNKSANNSQIETDYIAHKENNPRPSKEAVTQKDDKGAGKTIKWVLILAVIALLVAYLIYAR